MAISTAGYRISAQPRYTPVDPSLVAFNPSAALGGVMDAFKTKAALDKLKADVAAQAELAATREARIKAENARNQAIADLSPVRSGLETAESKEKLRALAPVTDATIAGAQAATAKAKSAVKLADAEEEVQRTKLMKEISEFDDFAATHEKKLKLVQKQLDNALANADSDAALEKALKQAQIDKTKADAEYLRAHGKYLDAGGSQGAPKDPASQLNAVALTMKRTIDGPYALPSGGTGNLMQYKQEVYDDEGKPRTRGKWNPFVANTETPINPEAEAALRQYNNLYRVQGILAQRLAGLDTPGIQQEALTPSPAPVVAPSATKGPSTPTPQRIRLRYDENGKLITQ